jgi:hypothetical protein
MPDRSPFHESQKLVRCEVVNRYQESSVRFIEIGSFKLWEYLMTSKHSLKVGDPRLCLCLWVDDSEYQANANVFDRAGDIEKVDRIVRCPPRRAKRGRVVPGRRGCCINRRRRV